MVWATLVLSGHFDHGLGFFCSHGNQILDFLRVGFMPMTFKLCSGPGEHFFSSVRVRYLCVWLATNWIIEQLLKLGTYGSLRAQCIATGALISRSPGTNSKSANMPQLSNLPSSHTYSKLNVGSLFFRAALKARLIISIPIRCQLVGAKLGRDRHNQIS